MGSSDESGVGGGSRSLAATLRRIIDAARKEFSDVGFDRARMEAIATSAGVSRQLVYLYYGSKEGLYKAVADEEANLAHARLSQIDYDGAPVLDVLADFIGTIFDYYGQPAAVMTIDTATHNAKWLNSASKVFEVSREFNAKIGRTLDRGKAERLIDDHVDPSVFYASVPMMITAWVVMGRMSGLLNGRDFSTPDADRFWRRYIKEMLIRSVLRDEARPLPSPPDWPTSR